MKNLENLLHQGFIRPCGYRAHAHKYKAIFQAILSPSQHMHTYLYNSIQHDKIMHLNIPNMT
ncbi:Zinc finger CCHC domain-containing 2 [Gossypium arboreum]|uniref:Zinc finger CCHC domain-containing 2 n=1 Tax=Gossypium arboreum TaxID=29729 RepID=A0A0B0PQW9_GOSAR|nr:Zinc finger CCHC domain-containing 2 [Gossypium arboreum]